MGEIEIGEYVRTKTGYIAKLIGINRELGLLEFDKPIYKEKYKPSNIISFTKFNKRYLKHFKDIEDLIEPGDIIEILCNELTQETNTIRIKDIEQLKAIKQIPKFVKSIVTKEQFSSMEYRLED